MRPSVVSAGLMTCGRSRLMLVPHEALHEELSDGYELEDVLDRAAKMHERALATISGADCRIG